MITLAKTLFLLSPKLRIPILPVIFSPDVTSFFSNLPLQETIDLAINLNFNLNPNLNFTKTEL